MAVISTKPRGTLNSTPPVSSDGSLYKTHSSSASRLAPMGPPSSWGCSPSAAFAIALSLHSKSKKRISLRSSIRDASTKRPSFEPLDSFTSKGQNLVVVTSSGEGSDRTRRRGSAGLGLKYFSGRPLWRRIFFASKKVRSLILLNVLTVIYASDIPVLKEVEAIMDPALFTVVRFVLSAIPFVPFVYHARGDCQIRAAGLELGFWASMGYLSQSLGLITSDAGRASFISAITVIVVPLIEGMFGATVSAITWSGALISLLGIAVLENCGSPACVGDIMNFISTVFFGIHTLRTGHISRSTSRNKFLALLGYEICLVALSSAVWFVCKGIFDGAGVTLGPLDWGISWDWASSFPWVPALYTGIFSTGLCLWAEMAAMRDVSATEAAIIYGLEPVWGAAFAWFLLDERWGGTEWIGAALLICGSLTVQILGSTQEKSFKNEERSDCNLPNSSNKQNNLSLSTVMINSRKSAAKTLYPDKL